jgi:ferric-dicitrate binding protein FerR (iron transport regulator)
MGLEAAAPSLDASGEEWDQAARRTAGELEQAWQRLRRTAEDEMSFWDRRIEAIRSWRRPWLPLLAGGGVALGLGTWLGLVLGGYLPVPGLLRPFAEWIWSLPWP